MYTTHEGLRIARPPNKCGGGTKNTGVISGRRSNDDKKIAGKERKRENGKILHYVIAITRTHSCPYIKTTKKYKVSKNDSSKKFVKVTNLYTYFPFCSK